MASSGARAGHESPWRAGFVVAAFLLSSCGYTFAAAPGILNLTSNEAVNILPFANSSLQPDAATIFTRAVARALAERGGTIAERGGTLVLTGTVDSVTVLPTGSGNWSVTARIHTYLKDPSKENKVLGRSIVFDTEGFLSGDDTEGSEVSRRLATTRLLERLAAASIDRMTP